MDDALDTARLWLTYASGQDESCLSIQDAHAVARALLTAHERIRELEAKQSWQPIETAPINQQPFLAVIPIYYAEPSGFSHYGYDVIFRDSVTGEAMHAETGDDTGWPIESYVGWMPLPEPPK